MTELDDGPVDWELAVRTAELLAPSGPRTIRNDVDELVAGLHAAADRARGMVAETTRLPEPDDTPVLAVSRGGWARANTESFAALLGPVLAEAARREARPGAAGRIGRSTTRATTAVEMGGVLAMLSTRVLGQFDVFGGSRRLLLVAPNVMATEARMGVEPGDFRLWVCLHEQTHAAQFAAAPWLHEHLRREIRDLAGGLSEPGALASRLRVAAGRLPGVVASAVGGAVRHDGSRDRGPAGAGLVDLFQTPEERAATERITAVMSLLEGHADVMMDEVGTDVVPTLPTIRARFEARRDDVRGLDGVLRRLLGLDAKLRQYRDGAAFVRGVVGRAGLDAFNEVWAGPENLPTPEEIADPAAWVSRVRG